MKTPYRALSSDAIAALQRGSVIDAIKITREKTGLGLKESKDVVDAYLAGKPLSAPSNNTAVPLEAVALLEAGDLIGAVKIMRASAGLGMKDSKDTLDRYLENHPSTNEKFKSATATQRNSIVFVALGIAAACFAIYACLKWLKV